MSQGSLRADGSNVSHLLLSAVSPDLFCRMSGDGGPGKNAEAGSNHSSLVISAFKGNCITCILTPYFSLLHVMLLFHTQINLFFLSHFSKVFQQELDTKHDKYERLVKISRDITIESKRTIFLLHRVTRYI